MLANNENDKYLTEFMEHYNAFWEEFASYSDTLSDDGGIDFNSLESEKLEEYLELHASPELLKDRKKRQGERRKFEEEHFEKYGEKILIG